MSGIHCADCKTLEGEIARLYAGIAALDQARADAIVARTQAEMEKDRLKERERFFADALDVCDGGQYRNDWPGAMERCIRDRDAARAQVQNLTDEKRDILKNYEERFREQESALSAARERIGELEARVGMATRFYVRPTTAPAAGIAVVIEKRGAGWRIDGLEYVQSEDGPGLDERGWTVFPTADSAFAAIRMPALPHAPDVSALTARIEALEGALRWYAVVSNYWPSDGPSCTKLAAEIEADEGQRARDALAPPADPGAGKEPT